ncbi:MAG: plasmid pRiA4b ORF-3 family protein [Actinomycetes bacterium]
MVDSDNVIPFPNGRRGSDTGDADELAQTLMDQAGGPHAALEMLQQWMATHDDMLHARLARPQPTLLPRRPERVAYTVRVDLEGAKPPIWRRLRLASDLTLDHVHGVLQVAMGWTDSHLHHFKAGPDRKDFQMVPFLTSYDLMEGEDDGIPEEGVRLDEVITEPGHRVFYEYDFGDSWEHTIKLEKIEPWRDGDPVAHCLDGRRACPPEDVGGIHLYHEVLDALGGKVHEGDREWMAERLDWLPPDFDPAAFDRDETNERLAADPLPDLAAWHDGIPALLLATGGSLLSPVTHLVAQATSQRVDLTDEETDSAARRYTALLRAVGDGLTLTAAGYLPPRIVATLFAELDLDEVWIGRGNREDLTAPVLTLRESATALGLVRKSRGRLTVTAAGKKCAADPHALLRHIAGRLPAGRRDSEKDAGLLALLRTAGGKPVRWDDEEFGVLFSLVGWVSQGGRQAAAAYHSARPTLDVLDQLAGWGGAPESRARIANSLLQRR